MIIILPFILVFQVYFTSMAMLLTMVLSVYLFNFKPTVQVRFHAIRSHAILKVLIKLIILF